MSTWKEYYNADLKRYKKGGDILSFLKTIRKAHFCHNKFLLFYYRWKLQKFRNRFGLEIPYTTNIGKGLYIGHPNSITINPKAIIGENCSIHKGALIGRENRGKRQGSPQLGNFVWVGINAVIIGNVTIGDDVLIAPNSFVNCDVPSHSVVFGNPCIIKHRDNATEGYINTKD